MSGLTRITFDPAVMGGKPCIRGMRVTVGTVVGLLAAGRSVEEVLDAYPYLEEGDVREALAYAAWRAQEAAVPLDPAAQEEYVLEALRAHEDQLSDGALLVVERARRRVRILPLRAE